MAVKDIAFVAYSVADVPRSVAFYRDVIGLRPGQSFGEHWAEFEVGNTTFGVGRGEGIGIAPGSQQSAAFEVEYAVPAKGCTREPAIDVTLTTEPLAAESSSSRPRANMIGAKKFT